MRIELHIHTEDIDLFKDERKNYQGEISIPETNAKLIPFGITHDKSQAMGTNYILDCFMDVDETDMEKFVDWLYSKIENKSKKVSVGDLRGKLDYCDIDKDKILNLLSSWIKNSKIQKL